MCGENGKSTLGFCRAVLFLFFQHKAVHQKHRRYTMKLRDKFLSVAMIVVVFVGFAQAQGRQDATVARNIGNATITLDGVLNEPEWKKADSVKIEYGKAGLLPTGGWRPEFQEGAVTDPTRATVKFLSQDKYLYISFTIPDSSIVGSVDWARWDAILMSVKDKSTQSNPALASEYFLTYWYAGLGDGFKPPVGGMPRFVGKFGNFNDTLRTSDQKAAWDAGITIDGSANDGQRDKGWVVEMKIDLEIVGYKPTQVGGDIVGINFSIWDCDYLYEGAPDKISTTRTHLQSPWGNANANNVQRIVVDPAIGLNSVPTPLAADVTVPLIVSPGTITLDGQLTEAEWNSAYSFNIAFDDSASRKGYPTVGSFMSGQFQPELNGKKPPVLDAGNAKIKMMVKGTKLYVAADVSDQLVQGSELFDQIDGIALTLADRDDLNSDNLPEPRYLRINWSGTGDISAYDYLPQLVDSGKAKYGAKLKPGTTINKNDDIDVGYIIEAEIDLAGFGYDANYSDRALFAGLMYADGDSFDNPDNNYGTRAWWFRENAGGPAYAWMRIADVPTSNENEVVAVPTTLQLNGNYPNPFNPSTVISFNAPTSGNVTITVYNTLGQLVGEQQVNNIASGTHNISFNGSNLTSGVYYYRVTLVNELGSVQTSAVSKMMLIK